MANLIQLDFVTSFDDVYYHSTLNLQLPLRTLLRVGRVPSTARGRLCTLTVKQTELRKFTDVTVPEINFI